MIDLDRGVTKRRHKLGFDVCMYKDMPGFYYDVHSNELSEQIAKEAGFDVSKLGKERTRRARLQSAMDDINAEFGTLDAGTQVAASNGFRTLHEANGLFVIEDPDGNILTPQALPKDAAVKLMRDLAKAEKTEAA